MPRFGRRVTNHSQTRFYDSMGEWITGAQVPLDDPARGRERLLAMLELAIDECLEPYSASPDSTDFRLLSVRG